jgi:hypothetical protein
MPNFSVGNFNVFSMHDLDPSRTPMWAFGHSKLGDRWIPVALPPPVRSRATFSAGLRARRNPQLIRAFARKPPDCDTPAETRNSLSPAVRGWVRHLNTINGLARFLCHPCVTSASLGATTAESARSSHLRRCRLSRRASCQIKNCSPNTFRPDERDEEYYCSH